MPHASKRIEEFTARYPGPQTEIDAIIANPRRWNAEQSGNLLTFDRLVRVEIARWAPILKAAAASTN
jgi:hypothetical protein